jgi:hypothetical protein
MSNVIAAVQFVSYWDHVLLAQTGTNYPIAEIAEGGILRTLPMKLPAGSVINSLLPSSSRTLYGRVAGSQEQSQGGALLQFAPVTGEALRRISASSVPVGSIACEAEGTWLAFKQSYDKGQDNGVWNLLTASE